MLVYDATAPAETYSMGPGMPETDPWRGTARAEIEAAAAAVAEKWLGPFGRLDPDDPTSEFAASVVAMYDEMGYDCDVGGVRVEWNAVEECWELKAAVSLRWRGEADGEPAEPRA